MSVLTLPQRSIASLLFRMIFGSYFIVTFSVTLLQLGLEYYHVKDSISEEIEALPSTFERGIGDSIWTYNNDLLKSILIGMKEIPIVVGVKIENTSHQPIQIMGQILNDDGKLISYDRNGELLTTPSSSSIYSLFSHQFPIRYIDEYGESTLVGTGTIYSSTELVVDRVAYGFVLIFVNSMIKVSALYIIFLFFVRKYLGTPLGAMANDIRSIHFDHLDNASIKVQTPENNELKVLEESFNRMIEKLSLEMRRIQEISSIFQKFVPYQFIHRLSEEGIEKLKVGAANDEIVTILFSDIRSFTSISENMEPQALLNFINRYLSHMNQPIHQYHGFIDKFIGDAIMALFDRIEKGYLIQVEDAIYAALGMQKALIDLNHDPKENPSEIRTGIGIHTGKVILGTVGSKDRMDSTVLGDSVNLASRLEGLTKTYGVNIIISESVIRLLATPAMFCVRPIDWVLVKGKKDITEIYEIYDNDPDDLKRLKQETSLHLLEGLTHRLRQNWRKALESFQAILDQNPQDTVAQFHFQYCLYLKENPPSYDWNGATDPNINILSARKEIYQMVQWKPDYAVGIELIDSQHQELFARINQLVKATQQGMIKEEVIDSIQFLQVYVDKHFREEQEFMRSINYPEYANHLEMHNYFVIVVQQLQEDYEYEGINLDLALKIQNKVIDWLVKHICKEDLKIAKWYENQLTEGSSKSAPG